jgi:hypothetical protein
VVLLIYCDYCDSTRTKSEQIILAFTCGIALILLICTFNEGNISHSATDQMLKVSFRIPVGRDFSHTSTPALGFSQPPVQWVPDISQG